MKQRQLVPLDLVPAGHSGPGRCSPGLDHAATLSDITVIGDGGQIYRGAAAWIVCMWALRDHRGHGPPDGHTPAGMKIAKQVVLGAARYREHTRDRQAGAAPTAGRTAGRTTRRTGWFTRRTATGTSRPPVTAPAARAIRARGPWRQRKPRARARRASRRAR
ncbi:DUF393 domain-containing protein [Streptomyces sp. KL116D]|uniref:DUF393 domain-containing protein n=1 Tax=Streptomyces sp. KL116D TaxID=3045152 RepID=UPI00355620BA